MVANLREQLKELKIGGKTLLKLLLKIGWYMAIWKGKLKTELCILEGYPC